MKKSEKQQPKILYFDHAATTPIIKSAKEAMDLAYEPRFGNAGSIHRAGMNSVSLLDKARETVAESLGGEFRGVVFTSGATEANNLFLKGAVKKYMNRARAENLSLPARIIISSSEHDSVEQVAEKLSEEGIEVLRVPVKKDGEADIKKLEEAINGRTVAVSFIFTNNETGAINNVKKAAKIIATKKKERQLPLFHIDASQSFRYENCSFAATGADAITLSSHKIGGPKGVGVLAFRESALLRNIESQISGGGQEFGIRSGTENVPAIIGFSFAFKEAIKLREAETKRVGELKTTLIKKIIHILPEMRINGPKPEESSPHILNIWLPGILAETLVMRMDMEGVAISYGSACSARAFKPSRAIMALGYSETRAKESIRISLGRETGKKDINEFVKLLKRATASLRFPKSKRRVA